MTAIINVIFDNKLPTWYRTLFGPAAESLRSHFHCSTPPAQSVSSCSSCPEINNHRHTRQRTVLESYKERNVGKSDLVCEGSRAEVWPVVVRSLHPELDGGVLLQPLHLLPHPLLLVDEGPDLIKPYLPARQIFL